MPPATTISCGRPESSFCQFLALGNIGCRGGYRQRAGPRSDRPPWRRAGPPSRPSRRPRPARSARQLRYRQTARPVRRKPLSRRNSHRPGRNLPLTFAFSADRGPRAGCIPGHRFQRVPVASGNDGGRMAPAPAGGAAARDGPHGCSGCAVRSVTTWTVGTAARIAERRSATPQRRASERRSERRTHGQSAILMSSRSMLSK